MARLTNEDRTHPSVRALAIRITAPLGRDTGAQIVALRSWLAGVWRFVRDPAGVELIHRPARLLDEFLRLGYVVGDCDDAAVLAAALGKAVGFPARFMVLGFFGPRAPFSHVYTELLGPDGWAELDVTRSAHRPMPTRCKTWRV